MVARLEHQRLIEKWWQFGAPDILNEAMSELGKWRERSKRRSLEMTFVMMRLLRGARFFWPGL